jgi:drug/metabolite transporter (DMT)-like permease
MTYRQGVLVVAGAAILWSLTGLGLRRIEAAGVWAVLFWRSVGVVPVLLLAIRRQEGGVWAPLRASGWPGLIGGAGLALAFAGAIQAIQTTSVANAVFLYSATPLIAALLSGLLLGERVRPVTWAAIALAGVGLWIMLREGISLGFGAGSAAALAAALGFAVFTLALRWRGAGAMLPAVLLGALISMAASAVVAGPAGLAIGPRDLAISLALGAVVLACGLWLYTLGARVLPATDLTLLAMIEVVLSPLWVWLVLGETARVATLAGGAVILGALVMNARAGGRVAVRAV